jgi:hypothetical protein
MSARWLASCWLSYFENNTGIQTCDGRPHPNGQHWCHPLLTGPGAAKSGQYLFWEIEDLWCQVRNNVSTNLFWCPGHQNILGNKAADSLAKEATSRNATPDQVLPASTAKVIEHIAKIIQTSSKQTRHQKISPLPIVYPALINQLTLGHLPLYHHLFKSKRHLNPICPFCPGRETTLHLFDFFPKHWVA